VKEVRDLRHITEPAEEFNGLFAPRRTGYLGADAALSIHLPDQRVLWVFGDTLIGRQENGKRMFHAMPRNTVALQPPGSLSPEDIEWVLNNKQGEPHDFFSLPQEEHAHWFWPGTGICIDGELFVFGYSVTAAKGECEALSFCILDSWVMRVRETSGHPLEWQIEAKRINKPSRRLWYSSASLFESPYLYLTGIKFVEGADFFKDTSTVLARVHVDELFRNANRCRFEYLNNSGESYTWSVNLTDPVILYKPGVTESSLFYDAPRKRYLATTYGPRKPDFFITTAPTITGPWSAPALIFREEQSKPVDSHLFYAMRMHPHLRSNEDEMILTYLVNTRSVSDLLTNCNVYYPHFLKIYLDKI